MVAKHKGRVPKSIAVRLLWDDKQAAVRRNLFGYYERESKETCQLLHQQVSNMAEKSQEAWNFDFMNESPKKGRYLWHKVPSCDVPFWYAAVSRPALKDFLRQNAENISCENFDCPFVEGKTESPLPKHEGNDLEKNEIQPLKKKPKFVQTTIKDFTRVKKKQRSSCRLRLKQLRLFPHRLRNHPPITAH